jgi:hypothetical protein
MKAPSDSAAPPFCTLSNADGPEVRSRLVSRAPLHPASGLLSGACTIHFACARSPPSHVLRDWRKARANDLALYQAVRYGGWLSRATPSPSAGMRNRTWSASLVVCGSRHSWQCGRTGQRGRSCRVPPFQSCRRAGHRSHRPARPHPPMVRRLGSCPCLRLPLRARRSYPTRTTTVRYCVATRYWTGLRHPGRAGS